MSMNMRLRLTSRIAYSAFPQGFLTCRPSHMHPAINEKKTSAMTIHTTATTTTTKTSPQKEESPSKKDTNKANVSSGTGNDACGNLIFVRLVRSPLHHGDAVYKSVKALQLRRVNQVSVLRDTPTTRGLVYNCRHLLEVNILSTRALFPNGIPSESLEEQWEHIPKQERLRLAREQKRKKKQELVEKRFKHIEEKYAHFRTGEKAEKTEDDGIDAE